MEGDCDFPSKVTAARAGKSFSLRCKLSRQTRRLQRCRGNPSGHLAIKDCFSSTRKVAAKDATSICVNVRVPTGQEQYQEFGTLGIWMVVPPLINGQAAPSLGPCKFATR